MSSTAGQYGTQTSETPKGLDPSENKKEDNSWILDQLDLGGTKHMVSGTAASC